MLMLIKCSLNEDPTNQPKISCEQQQSNNKFGQLWATATTLDVVG